MHPFKASARHYLKLLIYRQEDPQTPETKPKIYPNPQAPGLFCHKATCIIVARFVNDLKDQMVEPWNLKARILDSGNQSECYLLNLKILGFLGSFVYLHTCESLDQSVQFSRELKKPEKERKFKKLEKELDKAEQISRYTQVTEEKYAGIQSKWIQSSIKALENLQRDIKLTRNVRAEDWNDTILEEVLHLQWFFTHFFANLLVKLKSPMIPEHVLAKFRDVMETTELETFLLHSHF